jgi:anti-sigma factor RsiW
MTMNRKCRDFEDRLGDILAGALSAADLRAAMEHRAECPRCRRLMDVARGKIDLLPFGSGQVLAREVLRNTSGPVCGRAREQICDFVDGELSGDDARLLEIHIESCRECAGLAQALKELHAELPRMAELDPGPVFTREVLAATTRRQSSSPGRLEALAAWWDAVIRRPRFAWEAAYLGTLLLALVIGNPAILSMAASAPLQGVRGKTRQMWTVTTAELTGLSSAAVARAEETAGHISNKVNEDPAEAKESAARVWQRGQQWAENLTSLGSSYFKEWIAGTMQMLRDTWKSLRRDRTFS